MKKTKIAFWIVILGFIALVMYQNQDFFLVKRDFHIDLFFKNFLTPPVLNAVWFIACFLLGLLIAYFSSLSERFRSNKTIKGLNATINELSKKNTALEQQVDALQRRVAQYAPGEAESAAEKLNS
jgi:cell division protein FtsB